MRALLALLIVVLLPGPSAAPAQRCALECRPDDSIVALHSRAVEVTSRLHAAADAGLIDPQLLARPAVDAFALHRASRRLQYLRDLFAVTDAAPAPSFAVLLVESALWSRYHADGEAVALAVDVEGPRPGETVVLTAEAVLAEIESQRMSWLDAVQQRIVVIVPPAPR
jgi:hypothetical protein